MRRCCFCSAEQTKDSDRTFHKFPFRDLYLLEQWLENIPLKNWKPTKGSLLCSDHFTDDCLDRTGWRVNLEPNSIPTIFENIHGACVYCKRKRSYPSQYTFFKFPIENHELLAKWFENMRISTLVLTNSSLLCSSHFEESCLKVKGKYVVLRENSVPTIFGPVDDTCLYQGAKENISNYEDDDADPNYRLKNEDFSEKFMSTGFPKRLKFTTTPELRVISEKLDFEQTAPSPSDCRSTKRRISTQSVTSDGEAAVPTTNAVDDTGSTPTSPVHVPQQLVDHDHHYEDPQRMLRKKITQYQHVIKQKDRTIKLQKQKIDRLQTQLLSLKKTIGELRKKRKASETNTTNSTESLNDDVDELL